MAFKDSWHRALVYFGLAEDRDPYEEDDYDDPEPATEERQRVERQNVRRLSGARRARRDDFDDIFADDAPPVRGTTQLRPVGGRGNGRSGVRIHLVIPKSF